jgi:hypothetical protein
LPPVTMATLPFRLNDFIAVLPVFLGFPFPRS